MAAWRVENVVQGCQGGGDFKLGSLDLLVRGSMEGMEWVPGMLEEWGCGQSVLHFVQLVVCKINHTL